jgi:hypothetical protein
LVRFEMEMIGGIGATELTVTAKAAGGGVADEVGLAVVRATTSRRP